ncbi:threonyl-tRNA synthetase, putative [Trypanosoma brucei gambiense DAL972]|uniref:threonine--tRNA ligase n=1 Tax=Trypanosoma brucei gambiense (strain MHOM/CI/86/DAL972) TaxID=679716 RepID=C9ZNN3_TRYB9|nr:threonyl-tRNA synthetase, putative [Trypanosoma brucei gambiense DAL972]CBH11011.1 threonyl-tRNA synthetase, putative [Trypanosoma brucei gambiense DAL972]|eukprot:XP_011773298.1 threonyl-tRNA synthetase, putative [Trypanosoma brucei gambiense DAL972]
MATAVVGKKKGGATVDLKQLQEPDFWKTRNAIFDELYAAQQEKYKSMQSPISITLNDGKQLPATSWLTTPIDIAKKLSNSLAERVVAARVNEEIWDLTRPFEGDATLELLDWDDADARHVFWHSSSHVLGYALERVFQTRLSVGPALEEGGFFYEGETNRPVTEADYTTIETAMQELVKMKVPFQRLTVKKEDALRLFQYTEFKSKILASKVPENGTCTVYRCGNLIDPCRGPHLPDTGRVKSFSLTKNSSSYFEGKAENAVLQRVYGISFPKQTMLTEWKKLQEEAARRDHRTIGRHQQLFHFHEASPGNAFWLPHGARIYNTLIEFQRKQYRRRGFEEVVSPNMFSSRLWMVSGHWDKYADNMFLINVEKEDHGMKPMNCPGHCLMFAMQPHSYRELPIRYADFGVLHRNELSGALTGLTRVRRFQQDDAHIFCRMDQVKDEIHSALIFLKDVYDVLGFKFFLKHSTRPENKLGSDEMWDEAESYLQAALNSFCGIPDELPDPFNKGSTFVYDGRKESVKKLRAMLKKRGDKKNDENSPADDVWPGPTHEDAWEENTGDGAFYGPKIDIVVEDALRRRHQCATIQLDFNLPKRFGLKYTLPSNAAGDDGPAPKATECHKDPNAELKADKPEGKVETAAGAPKSSYEKAAHELNIDQRLDANQARPVMIHRAIFGSLERCIAILCEHYGGDWPFWLSPRQVIVVPVSLENAAYAQTVRDTFFAAGFFADVDNGTATLEKKIRNAELARYNFILVVGQAEQEGQSVNVRTRDNRRHGTKTLDEALQWLRELADKYDPSF